MKINKQLSRPVAIVATLLALLALLALPASAQDQTDAFSQVVEHYEKAHLSLTQDSTAGVAQSGEHIVRLLTALEADFSAERAGIDPLSAASIRQLLPELKNAAKQLATASDLSQTREAFYALSKPLVRWRKAAASDDRPIVAYCSMTRRSWLQPQGEIANPYHGQSMLRCGEVVDR